jgi:hypothetical protein
MPLSFVGLREITPVADLLLDTIVGFFIAKQETCTCLQHMSLLEYMCVYFYEYKSEIGVWEMGVV